VYSVIWTLWWFDRVAVRLAIGAAFLSLSIDGYHAIGQKFHNFFALMDFACSRHPAPWL